MVDKIKRYITYSASRYTYQIIPFGVLGFITFPLFYFLNPGVTPGVYENLPLRIIASILCFPLIFKNYWPESIRKYLPFYWYLILLYTLPFFFTYMALKNNLSPIWQTNVVQLMLFLVLLVDWISFVVLMLLGAVLGYFLYFFTTPLPSSLLQYKGGLVALSLSILTCTLFSRNRQKLEDERLSTMKSISASIAHELRTPLRTITSAAHGIKKYLPLLMDSYLLAKKANLPVQTLDPFHYESLVTACDDIDSEAQASFTVINMLLVNVSQLEAIGKKSFKKCSIHQCLDEALRRYPFDSDEAKLVHWQEEPDFDFKGDETLIIHVIFNLMKNALYQIKAAGKGEINIWIEKGEPYNKLHFKDTAKGISPKKLKHIFDMFFSDTYHGAGIGLAFCRVVMQSLNGKIEVISEEGEFAEFILYFPHDND